jgi:triphosphoribosyl-dephospho-CoA synthetase
MDWALFMASASALASYWEEQALEGMRCAESGARDALLAKLRSRGVDMESAMFLATGGVNTHKGAIFALSIMVGATGICLSEGDCSPDNIFSKSSEIISPTMANEFANMKQKALARDEASLTNGEKIFLRYGVGGIRKEAMDGFPSVRNGLAEYETALANGARGNDAALSALLHIMSVCEDTNVIHRAGFDFWRGEYMERVEATKKRFDSAKPDYSSLLELDEFLIEKNASPGGAADLLACTLFLYRSKIPDINNASQKLGQWRSHDESWKET